MSTGTNDGVIELAYFLRNRTSYVRVFYKYVHVGNSLIHSIFLRHNTRVIPQSTSDWLVKINALS